MTTHPQSCGYPVEGGHPCGLDGIPWGPNGRCWWHWTREDPEALPVADLRPEGGWVDGAVLVELLSRAEDRWFLRRAKDGEAPEPLAVEVDAEVLEVFAGEQRVRSFSVARSNEPTTKGKSR